MPSATPRAERDPEGPEAEEKAADQHEDEEDHADRPEFDAGDFHGR
jgi:hypothetical protein